MREPPTQARVALRATCASLTLSKQSLASASVKEKIVRLSHSQSHHLKRTSYVSHQRRPRRACALRSHRISRQPHERPTVAPRPQK